MIVENINKKPPQIKVLLAPLDWGLGHATRCIPIIHALTELKITVVLAATGSIATIFQKEFPTLKILPLKGYNITYGRTKGSFKFVILSKLPRIMRTISYERRWLRYLLDSEHFDAVISDNRFGMYDPRVKCIYITHQLNILTGSRLVDRIAQSIHYSFINRFSECWVPDVESDSNMAAILSHPKSFPSVPVKYLGLLSRFRKQSLSKNFQLLVILSGPEPQRTMLENILLRELTTAQQKAVFVRGLPAGPSLNKSIYPGLIIYDHVAADELSTLVQQAEMVISRCGYSTVMDLAVLHQKAILIPTPGQTEQEYLARHLSEKGYFFTCDQKDFKLEDALSQASKFIWTDIPAADENFIKIISGFADQLLPSNE